MIKSFADICAKCDAFIDEWPGSGTGPAHAVVGDFNFDGESLAAAEAEVRRLLSEPECGIAEELRATLGLLAELAAVPECIRDGDEEVSALL